MGSQQFLKDHLLMEDMVMDLVLLFHLVQKQVLIQFLVHLAIRVFHLQVVF